jgi:hypothetical protein
MTLLLRFLQGWLFAGYYASLAQDDPYLQSYYDYKDFLPLWDIEGGTNLALSPEPDWLGTQDSESVLYPLGEDTIAFLSLDEEDASSYSPISIDTHSENWPLDDFTLLNEEFNAYGESSFEFLVADSDVDCISYDEQSIARKRRANSCPATQPPTDIEETTKAPNPVFPPPGSNPGRRPGAIHDPKPRPWWSMQPPNSDLDFKYCPSGRKGYRGYYTCDSGISDHRWHLGGKVYNLIYVTPSKS